MPRLPHPEPSPRDPRTPQLRRHRRAKKMHPQPMWQPNTGTPPRLSGPISGLRGGPLQVHGDHSSLRSYRGGQKRGSRGPPSCGHSLGHWEGGMDVWVGPGGGVAAPRSHPQHPAHSRPLRARGVSWSSCPFPIRHPRDRAQVALGIGDPQDRTRQSELAWTLLPREIFPRGSRDTPSTTPSACRPQAAQRARP